MAAPQGYYEEGVVVGGRVARGNTRKLQDKFQGAPSEYVRRHGAHISTYEEGEGRAREAGATGILPSSVSAQFDKSTLGLTMGVWAPQLVALEAESAESMAKANTTTGDDGGVFAPDREVN